jgi:hypothetical protein
MRLSGHPLRTGRWRIAARIPAILLLATIVGDLPDAWCDPLPLQEDRPGLSPPEAEAPEACNEVCVPDCFCCSSTVPAIRPMQIERPAHPVEGRWLLVLSVASGFPSLPDHVPIGRI